MWITQWLNGDDSFSAMGSSVTHVSDGNTSSRWLLLDSGWQTISGSVSITDQRIRRAKPRWWHERQSTEFSIVVRAAYEFSRRWNEYRSVARLDDGRAADWNSSRQGLDGTRATNELWLDGESMVVERLSFWTKKTQSRSKVSKNKKKWKFK